VSISEVFGHRESKLEDYRGWCYLALTIHLLSHDSHNRSSVLLRLVGADAVAELQIGDRGRLERRDVLQRAVGRHGEGRDGFRLALNAAPLAERLEQALVPLRPAARRAS
jgi:hypothetical protein